MLKTFLHKKQSEKQTNQTSNFIYERKANERIVRLEKVLLDKAFFHNCQNWVKNRPPDDVRIEDIIKYYCSENDSSQQLNIFIPGIVYAWKKPNEPSIIIYDGIHRLLAAKDYSKHTNGANMLWCLLQTTITQDENYIVKDFVNLNKSVCVPTLYLDDTDVTKKLMCQSIADMLCQRYPTFVSPSRKPYIYNFNRDCFVDFISTLEVNFHEPGIDTKIFNELMGLNIEAKNYVDRHKIKYPNKCLYKKFFLFYLDKSYIKQQIENQCNL